MFRDVFRRGLAGVLLVAIAAPFGLSVEAGARAASPPQYERAGQALPTPTPQSSCRTFPEAGGKKVCGKFLAYWNGHGGLAQQGLPLSEEFNERSEIDGKEYTVQYFERAVFERHHENQPPHDVLLSLLGSMRYAQKYPKGARELPVVGSGGVTFPQTGKTVSGEFLEYWQRNGGLAQQGYPITNRLLERSELDGKEYTVQYFERAVFELHPENAPPNNVLLTQLGTLNFKSKYPNGTPAATNISVGEWGGVHVALQISGAGATIEYDCGRGTIDEPVRVDSNGRFTAKGTHIYEGGPTRDDPPAHPALFTGTVSGDTMTLTVTVTDRPGAVLGPYTIVFGKPATIRKCL